MTLTLKNMNFINLNISLVTKVIKKLNLYAYSFEKQMYIE